MTRVMKGNELADSACKRFAVVGRSCGALCGLLIGIFSSSVQAGLVVDSVTKRTFISYHGPVKEETSKSLGAWFSNLSLTDCPTPLCVQLEAEMLSWIGEAGCAVYGGVLTNETNSTSAHGSSELEVNFHLTAPAVVPVRIFVRVDGPSTSLTSAHVSLGDLDSHQVFVTHSVTTSQLKHEDSTIKSLSMAAHNFNLTASVSETRAPAGVSHAQFYVVIAASPCPADLTFDGQTDDADFSDFVVAYDKLACSDSSMPLGCPADFNTDNFVDDLDFLVFVAAYDALVCS